jgi:nucleoside-diphosphate-sugar epimerase
MRILLTGASSFTGFWFAKALAEAGHEVTAALASEDEAAYAGVRGRRLTLLKGYCRIVFAAAFGSDNFFSALREAKPDRLCHHWAEVREYRSPDFDVVAALAANTRRLVEYYCALEGVPLDRFVIANPFGPYEEPRFTDYLMKSWMKGGTARVSTPRYIRDNVPVDLLAKSYAAFLEAGCGGRRLGPSCYAETQGAFAERVAREVRPRLDFSCALEFAEQREFPEPEIRINTDLPDRAALGWSENEAWDGFVRYYEGLYG